MDNMSQEQIDQIEARFLQKYGSDVAEISFVAPENGANSTPYLKVGVLTADAQSRIEPEFEGLEVRVQIVEELRPLKETSTKASRPLF